MAKRLDRVARLANLPAWAQQELDDAEAEINRLLGKLASLSGRETTPISISVTGEHDNEFARRYLPEENGVDFDLPNGVRLNVQRDKNSVRVTEKTHTGQILVVPVTTGTINIGVIKGKDTP